MNIVRFYIFDVFRYYFFFEVGEEGGGFRGVFSGRLRYLNFVLGGVWVLLRVCIIVLLFFFFVIIVILR